MKPTILISFITMSVMSFNLFAQEIPEGFVEKTVTYQEGESEKDFRYLLMEPETVEPGIEYPLVLFLHGSGERGEDNRVQVKHFAEHMTSAEYRERFPCFVLVPQCPSGERWADVPWDAPASDRLASEPAEPMKAALAAFHQTLAEYPIDRSRLYLTGLSMGGYGSWDLAVRHSDWFAAVAPICGGGDDSQAFRLAETPLWAWHGDADAAVPVVRSRQMIHAIREANGLPRYTEIAGWGHDSWVPAYEIDGLLPWMFEQRKVAMEERSLAGLTVLAGPETPLKKGERIVFLGDSLTQAGVAPDGYISVLEDAVEEGRPDLGVHWIGAGISGNKVPDIQSRLDRDVLSVGPSVIVIFIGVNDVWHHDFGSGTSEEDYQSGLTDLMVRCQAQGATVVLATPPLIGEKPDDLNARDAMLNDYAAISREVASRFGVTVCDFRQLMPALLKVVNPDGQESGLLTTDGVHFTPAGNRYVAHQLGLAIYEALVRRNRS